MFSNTISLTGISVIDIHIIQARLLIHFYGRYIFVIEKHWFGSWKCQSSTSVYGKVSSTSPHGKVSSTSPHEKVSSTSPHGKVSSKSDFHRRNVHFHEDIIEMYISSLKITFTDFILYNHRIFSSIQHGDCWWAIWRSSCSKDSLPTSPLSWQSREKWQKYEADLQASDQRGKQVQSHAIDHGWIM